MGRCVGCVVEDANAGRLGPVDRQALLRALGHADCVPRKTHIHLDDHYRIVNEWQDRAQRAERERDEARADDRQWHKIWREALSERNAARADNDRLRVTISTARNIVGQWLADGDGDDTDKADLYDCLTSALSADADADAEPDQRTGMCGCGHVASKHAQGWKGCSVCACVEYADADAEPAGGFHHDFGCAHDPCECSGEPSRGEGDEQPKSLNELAREWGLPPLTWVHMGFIEPHEPAPDVDGAYMNHEMGRLEAPCLNCRNKPNCRNKVVVAIPNHAEGGRPRGGGDDGRSRAIEAATEVICYRPAAEDIIDRALASGGVIAREQYDRDTAFIRRQVNEQQDQAKEQYDRARVLEETVRFVAHFDPNQVGTPVALKRIQEAARAALEGGDRA